MLTAQTSAHSSSSIGTANADWAKGCVRNLTRSADIPFEPLALADRRMLEAGGLVEYLKQIPEVT
jgi:hypothetical protein